METNVPQQASAWGGEIYVINLLVDIKQDGKGVCVQYGNNWILANWTPAAVDGLHGDTYFVPSWVDN